MYTQLIKAEIKKILGELKHVAKSDFDALVTRVEALEKVAGAKAETLQKDIVADVKKSLAEGEHAVITDAQGVVAHVQKDTATVVTDFKTDAEKVLGDIKHL